MRKIHNITIISISLVIVSIIVFFISINNFTNHYKDSSNFPFREDYHLWIKIIKLTSKVCNLPKVLVHARFNENSVLRRGGSSYILSEFYFQKFLWNNEINNFLESFCIGSIRILLFLLPKKIKIIFYKLFLRY